METYEAIVDGDPTGILVKGYSAEAAWDRALEEVKEEYPDFEELTVRNIADESDTYSDYPNGD